MNRREAERLTRQADTLRDLGFTADEAEALRRISMTLRRWHELECGDGNGCIERDEETGRPYWYSATRGKPERVLPPYYIPDREAGAKRRLAAILNARLARQPVRECKSMAEAANLDLDVYIQTDPRGAALYILRPGDVPEGEDASAYYSRGVAVY